MSTNQKEIVEIPLVPPKDYRPLLNAKDVARLLGFGGARPEAGVYQMVKDGRIPPDCLVRRSSRHFLFHTDRVLRIIDGGGFVRQ
jgi:hypothetical protein